MVYPKLVVRSGLQPPFSSFLTIVSSLHQPTTASVPLENVE
jgi:hypothetical protein